MPKSTVKEGVVVKRDTEMQKAIKKLLRKKMRVLDSTRQQEDVVEKLIEVEIKKQESDENSDSEDLIKEREIAVKELEEIFGECGPQHTSQKTATKMSLKQPTSNSIRNLGNMDIIKVIEPNVGVNILEEDSEDEDEPGDKASVKDESIFSTTRSRFRMVK